MIALRLRCLWLGFIEHSAVTPWVRFTRIKPILDKRKSFEDPDCAESQYLAGDEKSSGIDHFSLHVFLLKDWSILVNQMLIG
jgi:hypothetical protein